MWILKAKYITLLITKNYNTKNYSSIIAFPNKCICQLCHSRILYCTDMDQYCFVYRAIRRINSFCIVLLGKPILFKLHFRNLYCLNYDWSWDIRWNIVRPLRNSLELRLNFTLYLSFRHNTDTLRLDGFLKSWPEFKSILVFKNDWWIRSLVRITYLHTVLWEWY